MKIAIADDEIREAELTENIIKEWAEKTKIAVECLSYPNGNDFLKDVEAESFDIAFLDIIYGRTERYRNRRCFA